jgi:hypothetical protein
MKVISKNKTYGVKDIEFWIAFVIENLINKAPSTILQGPSLFLLFISLVRSLFLQQ